MTSTLQLRSIQLRVSDLARSIDFYTRQLGFSVIAQASARADLATTPSSTVILTLLADATAPAPEPDAAGLFHAALLLPSAPALGAWLKFASQAGVEFDGASDHGVSEAIYFTDPDGNGLEFYCDRPRTVWPRTSGGELAMVTQRLNVPALVAGASPPSAQPLAGASWGHLHLRVTDLARSDAFYRAQLGMDLTQGSYPGARFLAADGYHHHVAINTWGHPRRPRSATALGLATATFSRAGLASEQLLADPDGIALRLTPLTDSP